MSDEPDYRKRKRRHHRIGRVVFLFVYMMVAFSVEAGVCGLLHHFHEITCWTMGGALVVAFAVGALAAAGCRLVALRFLRGVWPEEPDGE